MFDITVPMPNGSSVTIENVEVRKSKETLGVHKCLSGENKGALKAMQDKAQGWVEKAKKWEAKEKIPLVSTGKTVLA